MAKKNIIVVGGGAAGSDIARSLSAKLNSSQYNLILIDSRPFHIFLVASARLIVSDRDHLEETALIPLLGEKLFQNGKGTFMTGTVTAIEKDGTTGGQVLLESGEKLPYEILVLATGSTWEGPFAFPNDLNEATTFIDDTRSKFAKANHVLIAGGGAVGSELAGEIRDIWPEKRVTIVHGNHQLLNGTYSAKARLALEKGLRKRGVEVLLSDYVDTLPEPGVIGVTTRNGKSIDADLAIATRGPQPHTAFVESLGSDVLTKKGYIKVKPTLQVLGHPDVFAAGDVIDWDEQKQGLKAHAHAAIVTANILAVINKQPLKDYKTAFEMILVTNGRNGGVGFFKVFGGITLGDWFARLVKSKTLFVPKARAGLGFE